MNGQKDLKQPGRVITREELYEAVWSRPFKALAKEWNTNHLQLVWACKKMNVPRPDQHYWPLIFWGHQVKRKPLPARGRAIPGEMLLGPRKPVRGPLAVKARFTDEERRRLAETRAMEDKHRLQEQRRQVLLGNSEAWHKAKLLRRFIRACEAAMREKPSPARGWSEAWLAWARDQADRLDPMTNGVLETEREWLARPEPAAKVAGQVRCPR